MDTQKITVENPTRTRKWGWGWTNTPTGRDAYSIEIPSRPDYTGTMKQVLKAISEDRTYRSMKSGGTFTNTAWFYDGKRIVNRQEFNDWLDFDDGTGSVTVEVAA